jgi:large subunit ribosomal protein L24
MKKIRKGDQVIVITGRDKGKRGTVLRSVDDERCVVDGINVVKKHTKPNPMKGQPAASSTRRCRSTSLERGALQPGDRKADRVGIKTLADGKRVRVFKSNGESDA